MMMKLLLESVHTVLTQPRTPMSFKVSISFVYLISGDMPQFIPASPHTNIDNTPRLPQVSHKPPAFPAFLTPSAMSCTSHTSHIPAFPRADQYFPRMLILPRRSDLGVVCFVSQVVPPEDTPPIPLLYICIL